MPEAPLGVPASPIGLVGDSSSSLPSVPPRQGDHTGYLQGQYLLTNARPTVRM